jgi:HKD family nuclease
MLKATFFKNNDHYNLIVGSSNLTAQALSTNKEWNIKVSALDDSGLVECNSVSFILILQKQHQLQLIIFFRYEEVYKSNF